MRFRKLRIVWLAFWVLACVMLIALWIRSYWWVDAFGANFGPRFSVGIGPTPGALGIGFYSEPLPDAWTFDEPTPTEFWLANVVMPNGKPYPSCVWGVFEFNTSDGVNVGAPFWFLILMSILCGTSPWLLRRFSLRTLLIATTLIAVALGLIVWLGR